MNPSDGEFVVCSNPSCKKQYFKLHGGTPRCAVCGQSVRKATALPPGMVPILAASSKPGVDAAVTNYLLTSRRIVEVGLLENSVLAFIKLEDGSHLVLEKGQVVRIAYEGESNGLPSRS